MRVRLSSAIAFAAAFSLVPLPTDAKPSRRDNGADSAKHASGNGRGGGSHGGGGGGGSSHGGGGSAHRGGGRGGGGPSHGGGGSADRGGGRGRGDGGGSPGRGNGDARGGGGHGGGRGYADGHPGRGNGGTPPGHADGHPGRGNGGTPPGHADGHPGRGNGGTPPGHADGHPGRGNGWGTPPGHRDGHPGRGNGWGRGRDHSGGSHEEDHGGGYAEGPGTVFVEEHVHDAYCGHGYVAVYESSPTYVATPHHRPVHGPAYDPWYQDRYQPRTRLRVSAEATGARTNASLAGAIRLDSPSWGLVLDARTLLLPVSSGSEMELMAVGRGHLTYAVLAGPLGRLRVEGGVGSSLVQGRSTFGPSLGMSAELGLVLGLGLEASAHVTPFPFQAADWSTGANLSFGTLSLHGGWRTLMVNAATVTGVARNESSSGPYAAVAFTF